MWAWEWETIIAGLAAVIIGEAFVGRGSVMVALVGVMLGSLVYRLVIAFALSFRWGPLSLTPSGPESHHRTSRDGSTGISADKGARLKSRVAS